MKRAGTILWLMTIIVAAAAQQPFSRSRTAFLNDQQRAAEKILDSCEKRGYYTDSVHFYRAMNYARSGELKKAKKTVKALAKQYPAFGELDYLKGILSYNETNYARSIDEFSRSIEKNPTHYRAIYNRSLAYGMMDEYLFAIEDLGRLIALNPADGKIYYSRAYWYEYTGNYTEAAKDYSEAIKLDPRNFDAYLGLAFSYRQLGEKDRSCDVMTQAINAGSQIAAELRAAYCENE